MYEIRTRRKVLNDGTAIITFQRSVVGDNTLEVEVGTTGYCGGDYRHGGRSYFRIKDAGCTDMVVRSKKGPFGRSGFEVVLAGDSELDTMIKALKFITRVLEEETAEVYD